MGERSMQQIKNSHLNFFKITRSIILYFSFVIITFNLCISNAIANEVKIKKTKEIFQLSTITKANHIELQWLIPSNHVLYKDQIKVIDIATNKNLLTHNSLPLAKEIYDPVLEETIHVYEKKLIITIPWNDSFANTGIKIKYQGCEIDGLCFMPQTKTFIFNKNSNLNDVSQTIAKRGCGCSVNKRNNTENILKTEDEKEEIKQNNDENKNKNKNQNQNQTDLQSTETNFNLNYLAQLKSNNHSFFLNAINNHSLFYTLSLFFTFGILLAFTPCVLPLAPIVLGIITGTKKTTINKKRSIILVSIYILSVAITYAVAGLLVGILGGSLQNQLQHPVIISIMSIFLALFGLDLLEIIHIPLPFKFNQKIHNIEKYQKHGSIFGAIILGLLSALIISPCVTPALAGALAFLAQNGEPIKGGLALFTLGLGMGLPLLIMAIFGSAFLPKSGTWMTKIKALSGFILIGMAIWLLSRFLSYRISMILWGIWTILLSVYFGLFAKRINENTNQNAKSKSNMSMKVNNINKYLVIQKIICLTIFTLGIILIINAFTNFTSNQNISNSLKWQKVQNIAQLNRALNTNKPAIIMYKAKWCTFCKKLKKTLFTDKKVREALKDFNLINIDITKNNIQTKNLMNTYKVFGPPTIIIIDKQGKEIKDHRVTGGNSLSISTFLNLLKLSKES